METVANLLLRETYRPRTPLARISPCRPMADLRAALVRAQRFVLDEGMSALLAELSQVPFHIPNIRRPEVLNSLRRGARAPFPTSWFEIDARAFRSRLLEVGQDLHDATGAPLAGPDTVPPRWGWLIEEHPQFPTAVQLHEYMELDEGVVGTLPFHLVWQTTEAPLPWPADTKASEIAHGIAGFQSSQIGVVYDQPIPPERTVAVKHTDSADQYSTDIMVVETGGLARYAIALLATLSNIPAVTTEVKQDRGFVARGTYRKYLDHRTVRLTVPARADTRRLAHKLIAIARRKAHSVRGHWRLYQRGEGALCHRHNHIWSTAANGHAPCKNCTAWRTWISSHERGDATLGYVLHDYAVTRGEFEGEPQ